MVTREWTREDKEERPDWRVRALVAAVAAQDRLEAAAPGAALREMGGARARRPATAVTRRGPAALPGVAGRAAELLERAGPERAAAAGEPQRAVLEGAVATLGAAGRLELAGAVA